MQTIVSLYLLLTSLILTKIHSIDVLKHIDMCTLYVKSKKSYTNHLEHYLNLEHGKGGIRLHEMVYFRKKYENLLLYA
jgi:hypothetical protein